MQSQSLNRLSFKGNAGNGYNTDEIIRLHASILHKNLPDNFLTYLFMLNGEKSFDYPYTIEDKKLVKTVFQSIFRMKNFSGPYMIYPLLFRVLHDVMGVDSYADKNVLVSCNDNEFNFVNNIYSPDIRKIYDDDYINLPINPAKWLSTASAGSLIMNSDPKQCMKALKKITEYGLEDVLNLEAHVTAVTDQRKNSMKTIDVNQQDYRMIIKKIILNNNHEAYRVLLIFLQLIIINNYELNCPNYKDLLRMAHKPSHIIQTDIESGDFNRPIMRKRMNLAEIAKSSKPNNRSQEILHLIDNHQEFGFRYFDKVVDNAYRLMNPKYKKNWETLQDSIKKYYNYDYILAILPWDDSYFYLPYYYQPLYASQIMLEIVSNDAKTKRLKALWETKRLMQQVWIKTNGDGLMLNAANSLTHYNFFPRRYWDEDGTDYDISKLVIKEARNGGVNKDYMPPELLDYIRTGRPPETITSDSYWSAYPVEKIKDQPNTDPYDDALSKYEYDEGKHMVFKLRTPETEDEWQKWVRILERV